MEAKVKEREIAVSLRKRGLTVDEIALELGVSKSSVSLWVRNLQIGSVAQKRLDARRKRARGMAVERKREIVKDAIEAHHKSAKGLLPVEPISIADAKILCALIYWCEGTKSERSGMRFTNSDPELINFFLKLLRKSFDIDESKFRVCIHLHGYHDEEKQIQFWSKASNIGRQQFIKSYRKFHTKKQTREGYPGCVSVRYHSNDLARQLNTIARTVMQNMIV